MDIDMHYYGTYALARAAGLNRQTAETIAYAAEFVDDSTDKIVGAHPAGAYFQAEITAHHPTDLPANRDLDDQRMVWIPFHFLPGGNGSEFTQKLVCVKDSANARAMIAHHLDMSDSAFAVELIGVAAHVYADTFAHYGFSGISSRANRVISSEIKVLGQTDAVREYLGPRVQQFFAKYSEQGGLLNNFRTLLSAGLEAASGALGHGAVAVYPDQPYLDWQFNYEMDFPACRNRLSERSNHATFLEGSERLHRMFREFARRRPRLADPSGGRDWVRIKDTVSVILRTEGETQRRANAWRKAVSEGTLFKKDETDIPTYNVATWSNMRAELLKMASPSDATRLPLYRFYQAASHHRQYVLRELLPSNGIVII